MFRPFCPTKDFVQSSFVLHISYVYKCISTKHLGKYLIWRNILPEKIFVTCKKFCRTFVRHFFCPIRYSTFIVSCYISFYKEFSTYVSDEVFPVFAGAFRCFRCVFAFGIADIILSVVDRQKVFLGEFTLGLQFRTDLASDILLCDFLVWHPAPLINVNIVKTSHSS